MDLKLLLEQTENPKPYDRGTAVMWTDEYISRQLLQLHINPDHDVASRKSESIDTIIQWVLEQIGTGPKHILDMGCGPGLYTERMAETGHNVTGIDFSENSIEYARKNAENKRLNIRYICMNYLDFDEKDKYDVIMMIYCDFGALPFDERMTILDNIHSALKDGGVFIFDALNPKTVDNLQFQKNWEISDGGFWMEGPHAVLSQSFHFPDNKATLDQHIIIDNENKIKLYRFWNHYFHHDDIERIFFDAGFSAVSSYDDILKGAGAYNDKGVTFYKITK